MQVGETEPFICELLTNLTGIIQDLETHQIHMFYETVGLMISAETVPEKRDEYVVRTSRETRRTEVTELLSCLLTCFAQSMRGRDSATGATPLWKGTICLRRAKSNLRW